MFPRVVAFFCSPSAEQKGGFGEQNGIARNWQAFVFRIQFSRYTSPSALGLAVLRGDLPAGK